MLNDPYTNSNFWQDVFLYKDSLSINNFHFLKLNCPLLFLAYKLISMPFWGVGFKILNFIRNSFNLNLMICELIWKFGITPSVFNTINIIPHILCFLEHVISWILPSEPFLWISIINPSLCLLVVFV